MFCAPSRRDFLQILLGATLLPGQGRPGHSGGLSGITATQLSDNLLLFSGAGGNVVVATSPNGLAMVNGGLSERSADLLRAIAEHTNGKPVEVLFNTDWHPEHTGSNAMLGKSGVKIVAHEHTKQYLGAELFVIWQNKTYKAQPPRALPSQTFYTSGKMTFGAERIEYAHLGQAHTDGDIYVFFPVSNVLVAGDILSVAKYPIADYTTGGWLGGLLTATKTLLDLSNAETRVVPGAGPIQTRADLQAQHDMLAAMRERFVKMMRQGMGPEDMLAAGVTKDFDAKWGSPELFVNTTYRGMWLHVRELGGIV